MLCPQDGPGPFAWKGSSMNTTTTTNLNGRPDDHKAVTRAGATSKPDTCATPVDKSTAHSNTHDGKLVSITGNTMVMSSHEGINHSHTVAVDAKVCCDGIACKPEDLKVGSKVRVTTKTDDKHVATAIESLSKHAEFAKAL